MSALRHIREQRGLTQQQLGEYIGTTSVTISRYEKEDNRLTLPVLRRLAKVLHCRVSDIIGETQLDEPFPEVEMLAAVRAVGGAERIRGAVRSVCELLIAGAPDRALIASRMLVLELEMALAVAQSEGTSNPSTTSRSS